MDKIKRTIEKDGKEKEKSDKEAVQACRDILLLFQLLPNRVCSTFQDLSLSVSPSPLQLPFSQYLTRVLSARGKLARLFSRMHGTSLSSALGMETDRSRFARIQPRVSLINESSSV